MARVLAFTSPAAGHLFPLMPGLLELRARGHEVHVRTGERLVGVVREAGLEVEAADGGVGAVRLDADATVPRTTTDGDPSGTGAVPSTRGPRRTADGGARGELRRQAARAATDAADLGRAIAQLRPDVLLVDLASWGGAAAAEASGLPWALCNPYLCPLPGPGVPPFGLGLAPRGGPVGRVRDAVGWWVVRRAVSRAVLPGLAPVRASLGLPPLRDPLGLLALPDAVLQLSGGALEHPRERPPANLRVVGLQSWDPAGDAEAPAWLTAPGDPWVLVTCSTDGQDDASLAAAAIEAFRDEPVRVVVTLGAADPGDLPSAPNVRVEAFVPHGPVLRHASTVVCHGGMGIVGKALRAGTALVVIPYGRDQPEVAGRVAHARLGTRRSPRGLTAEHLRVAYREAVARRPAVRAEAAAMAAGDPAGAFADATEALVRRG